MDNERKIQELEERIQKLEAAENKRIRKRRAQIAFKLLELLIIVGILIFGYNYLNNKIIKPYQNKVDYVNEKVDNVEEFIQNKWNSIKNFSLFGN